MAHWVKAKTTTGSEIIINLDNVVYLLKVKAGQKNASQNQYGANTGKELSAIIVIGVSGRVAGLAPVA